MCLGGARCGSSGTTMPGTWSCHCSCVPCALGQDLCGLVEIFGQWEFFYFLPPWSKFRLKFALSQSCSWASLQGAGSSHSLFCNFCFIVKILFVFIHGMDGLSLNEAAFKEQCICEGFPLCWFHTSPISEIIPKVSGAEETCGDHI